MIENLFEDIITENFPNWVKKTRIQVQETQSPQNDKPKETTPRYIINKMSKVKRENFKVKRENN